MNIYVGADHRGFGLKNHLISWLQNHGYTAVDCGAETNNPEDDYVNFTQNVCAKVLGDPSSLGIVICGSGIGVSIAANRFKGIRCGLCTNPEQASHGRVNDHINTLALSSELVSQDVNEVIVESFLSAVPSTDPKYARRVQKLDSLNF